MSECWISKIEIPEGYLFFDFEWKNRDGVAVPWQAGISSSPKWGGTMNCIWNSNSDFESAEDFLRFAAERFPGKTWVHWDGPEPDIIDRCGNDGRFSDIFYLDLREEWRKMVKQSGGWKNVEKHRSFRLQESGVSNHDADDGLYLHFRPEDEAVHTEDDMENENSDEYEGHGRAGLSLDAATFLATGRKRARKHRALDDALDTRDVFMWMKFSGWNPEKAERRSFGVGKNGACSGIVAVAKGANRGIHKFSTSAERTRIVRGISPSGAPAQGEVKWKFFEKKEEAAAKKFVEDFILESKNPLVREEKKPFVATEWSSKKSAVDSCGNETKDDAERNGFIAVSLFKLSGVYPFTNRSEFDNVMKEKCRGGVSWREFGVKNCSDREEWMKALSEACAWAGVDESTVVLPKTWTPEETLFVDERGIQNANEHFSSFPGLIQTRTEEENLCAKDENDEPADISKTSDTPDCVSDIDRAFFFSNSPESESEDVQNYERDMEKTEAPRGDTVQEHSHRVDIVEKVLSRVSSRNVDISDAVSTIASKIASSGIRLSNGEFETSGVLLPYEEGLLSPEASLRRRFGGSLVAFTMFATEMCVLCGEECASAAFFEDSGVISFRTRRTAPGTKEEAGKKKSALRKDIDFAFCRQALREDLGSKHVSTLFENDEMVSDTPERAAALGKLFAEILRAVFSSFPKTAGEFEVEFDTAGANGYNWSTVIRG